MADQQQHEQPQSVGDKALQAAIPAIVAALIKAIEGLFHRQTQVMQAVQRSNQIPDDPVIQVPSNLAVGLRAEEPESGKLSIQKAIYSDAQGRDQGLVEAERVNGALQGTHNMPRQSRVVYDLTLYDVDGNPSGEILPAEVASLNLEFSKRIVFKIKSGGEVGVWQGNGANHQKKSAICAAGGRDGWEPNPGYTQNSAGFVGLGYRAWEWAQGFLFPTQIDGEGEVEVWVEFLTPDFAKVQFETNHLTFKTS